MDHRRATFVALAGYLAVFITLFSPVLAGGRRLAPDDAFHFHYPHFAQLPALWDPNLGTGFPVAADPQVMTWYPLAMLRVIVPFTYDVFIVAAYVMASWFTFHYVRAETEDATAAFVAGLIFGGCGMMMAHLQHATIIHAALWLPGLLLAINRLAVARRPFWIVALVSFTFCCITAGHLQIVCYVLAVASLYALAIHRRAARPVAFVLTVAAG